MNNTKSDCACRGRNLDKMLQPAILAALYNEKLHGFMLIRQIGRNPMFAGSEPDKAGVYKYLKKMEADLLLVSEWQICKESGKRRCIYSITEKGRQCLISWIETLKHYNDAIDKMIAEMEKSLIIKPS